MVDKEQKPVPKQKSASVQGRSVGTVKTEEGHANTSGESTQPHSESHADAWKCFVTTTKGSKLLLFIHPTAEVKSILSDVAKRHNAQCKDLGRIKCKYLALCQSADEEGFKLTNDMVLKDFAQGPTVYLNAYVEDSVTTAKRKAAENGEQTVKKAKCAPAANGAAGNASSEGPKKRGRPSNKEKAEREAAQAAAQAASTDGKANPPVQAQAAQGPASPKKVKSSEAAPSKQPAKVAAAKPAANAPAKAAASTAAPQTTKEESSSGDDDSSSGDDSSSDSEEGSPEPQQKDAKNKAGDDDDDDDNDDDSDSENGSSSEEEG